MRRIDLVFGQGFLSQWRSMGNQCQFSDEQTCVQLCGSTSNRSLGREITSGKGPHKLRHGRFSKDQPAPGMHAGQVRCARPNMYSYLYLSIYLSIYLPIYLSIYIYIYVYIHSIYKCFLFDLLLSMYIHICMYMFLFIYLHEYCIIMYNMYIDCKVPTQCQKSQKKAGTHTQSNLVRKSNCFQHVFDPQ